MLGPTIRKYRNKFEFLALRTTDFWGLFPHIFVSRFLAGNLMKKFPKRALNEISDWCVRTYFDLSESYAIY